MKIKILLAIVMLTVVSSSYCADEKPKPDTSSDSKIYVIYLGQQASYVLEGLENVDFKGIKCLKGRYINMTWVKNKTCYIPVDKVSVIVEYDSITQYKEEIQNFRDQQLK